MLLCAEIRYQDLSDAEEAKKLRDARRFAKGLFYNVRGPCLRRFIVRDDFSPFFESKDSADAAFAYFDKVCGPWYDGVVWCVFSGAAAACETCSVQRQVSALAGCLCTVPDADSQLPRASPVSGCGEPGCVCCMCVCRTMMPR